MVATPLNVEGSKVCAEIHARWLEHVVRRLSGHGAVHCAGHLHRNVQYYNQGKGWCTANKIPLMYSFSGNCTALSPNFHIHVSVSVFYIPRISPHIFLQQNIGRSIVGIHKSLTVT